MRIKQLPPQCSLLLFCLVSVLFLLIVTSSSFASIAVDRSIIYLTAGQLPRQDVFVYNHGAQKAYVETEVFEVLDPGTAAEKRQKAENLEELLLLVSPKKMVIAPNDHKRVRFSYLGDHSSERVFRINVTPVIGKIVAKETAVKLVVAYQILLVVTPDNAHANIVCERQGKQLLLTNKGNTNVLLTRMIICQSKDQPSNECTEVKESTRLYAGNTWLLDLPDTKSFVEFEVTDGSQSSRKIRRFPEK